VLIVGLTGGIGSGKSTAARLLADHGAVVIDVDAVGREVIAPGGRAVDAVVAEFGPGVLAPDGAVDRAAVARIVFADAEALSRLTAISHPAINDELVTRLAALPNDTIAVLDLAVLAESTLGRADPYYRYTFVVTVEAPAALREDRAVARGSERDDIRRRMAQQVTDDERRALADVVLTNDGTQEALAAQVDELWDQLEARAKESDGRRG
jgi:dephospho-CoA kinase